jgi:glutaredoxin
MENVVWSMDMCSSCDQVKELLKKKGIEFVERNCADLVNGTEKNLKAIRYFVKNNYKAPIVLFDGEFFTSEQLEEKFLTNE